MPAIIEADDDGMYVLKFRGAGQGVKALIAELLAAGIARSCELPVPEIVLVELDPELARTEPDPEIQDLIRSSGGINFGMDYLPGSVTFDPVADRPDSDLASAIVWFDAYVTNVDRTPRNSNMLMWHRRLHLIDHGASFYFHHGWNNYLARSDDPFPLIKDHVLLSFAGSLRQIDEKMTRLLPAELIESIVALVPENWLITDSPFSEVEQHRQAYTEYLSRRLSLPHLFVEEAIRARSIQV